jgi:hypothetical protein
MDACGSAPASGLSLFFLVLSFSITLFLALFFLGEVVAHEDTKTHSDSKIFDLFWLFYFDG